MQLAPVPQNCPTMDAGPDFAYMWPDEQTKKLVELSAPDYISRLMDWIEAELDECVARGRY